MKPLILGLGNDLLGDDAVGLMAARRLRPTLASQADVLESNLSGIALLDLFEGRDQVIVLDAMQSGCYPPGSVVELTTEDFRSFQCPSPHFSGLPELIDIAEKLGMGFPQKVRVLAVEIHEACEIGGPMCKEVADAIPEIVNCVVKRLASWAERPVRSTTQEAEWGTELPDGWINEI